MGVYAAQVDAVAEVRRLATEQGVEVQEEKNSLPGSIPTARWETAEGVACWVEAQAVKPRTHTRTMSGTIIGSPAMARPHTKLYDGEDDEIDESDEEGHYD
jgi:hypothetical protein